MFQSRKVLERRIEELEAALKKERHIAAFVNDAELPKCKSLACIGCEHIIFYRYQNSMFVLGCGKDVQCPDFQQTERSVENRQLLQEALLSRQ